MAGVARSDARGDRGQTAFDFLAGMTVFLVAIGFVFSFVPGMFQPFDTDTGPDMVTADRSAARLAEDLLVENVTEPGVLNATCTEEFFDGGAATCRFDDNANDLHAALAVDEFTNLNVTIESGETTIFAAGRAPSSTSDVVVAKRVVLLEGEHRTLFVRVW